MITPPSLHKGDTIGIVSTARKITIKELEPAIAIIEKWGLKAKLGRTIGLEDHQFAGDDITRANDFQEMMDDTSVKAIWCARGGYGTVRIIDMLDFSKFMKSPKWIIGYSDITVLHSHLYTMGIQSIHAQMPLDIEKKSEATQESLKKVLFGSPYRIEYETRNTLNRIGTANGILVGGNLSVLYSLCGSKSALHTDGKILFIEDLDEYLYHVDRMIQNLKRNGLFQNLSGLIVGGMSDMNDNTVPFGRTAEEIIFDVVSEYNFPVCFNFPAGHVNNNNALMLGQEVSLDIHESGVRLTF
jgi:muramoyltetrapeptide carboxypeptidase